MLVGDAPRPPHVVSLRADRIAAQTGGIKVGDRVLSVNGRAARGHVVQLRRDAPHVNVALFTISRPRRQRRGDAPLHGPRVGVRARGQLVGPGKLREDRVDRPRRDAPEEAPHALC